MNNIFSHIFLLAGIQGILLSILLFTRKANHSANILLGFSILALSVDLFDAIYYLDSFFYKFPFLFILTFAVSFLYGPIFYLYIKILSTGNKFKSIYFLHFIPFFLTISYLIPFLFLKSEIKIQYIIGTMENPSWDIRTFNYLKTIQGIIYTVLVFKSISTYNRKVKDSFSNIEKIKLNWFRNLLITMLTLWVLFAAGNLIKLFINIRYETIIHFAFSIIIYSIGYIALKQPEIVIHNYESPDEEKHEKAEAIQSEKYKKSGLADNAAGQLHNELINLMEGGKPYLDHELTLSKLADMLNASPHNLSEVINTKLNQNFYDFVNKYRVEEFKRKLNDPAFSNYNILAIAMDSGFNSKSSFNSIFKKHTQQTPSQYKESLQSDIKNILS